MTKKGRKPKIQLRSLRLFYYLILLYLNFSCQIDPEKVYGTYVPVSYKNTYDTITIKTNGSYKRCVYDKTGTKLLDYEAKYKLNANSIKFDDFYLNLDKDLKMFPEDVEDIDMSYTTSFERNGDHIFLCFGYYEGENCYEKIK
ncbi:hypothetical protein [uncultured Chryseobacterium sp.]|uniref:hypothetical protein n=1 Tax=uncultured Chryseobacterium sp. TaxID=259322 RepID=UPI0025F8B734|nr:hypothetical protein [uncultured Chryseobacterium sp.]